MVSLFGRPRKTPAEKSSILHRQGGFLSAGMCLVQCFIQYLVYIINEIENVIMFADRTMETHQLLRFPKTFSCLHHATTTQKDN